MKKLLLTVPVAVALCAGCANTKVRMSVIDFDFRKPDQIAAGAAENEAFYNTAPTVKGEAKALPVAFYQAALDAITKLEARLRVLSFESCPVGK